MVRLIYTSLGAKGLRPPSSKEFKNKYFISIEYVNIAQGILNIASNSPRLDSHTNINGKVIPVGNERIHRRRMEV